MAKTIDKLTAPAAAQAALDVAIRAQTRFWNSLSKLERLTGTDIDSSVDLDNYRLADLLESFGLDD